ncbi:hypothetical protein [Granulicella sp. dw_53]|uniref:hypothetical protein n=1 Tax=Granulicella sp. dw_53 TaxID=2719792 RepID=UPI001BD2D28E|nr:hypothetical protein [Granulicella sp. dw_53]
MLGRATSDGHTITARDYRVEQKVTHLGTLAGHRIVQVFMNIYPVQQVIPSGWSEGEMPPTQWKSLLVQVGTGNLYVAIYEMQSGFGTNRPMKPAVIYGTGPNAILGTYDPDSGNGGGCEDGYWWFDKDGAYAVDFSPLEKAIDGVLPPNSTYRPNCWALHPEKAELQSEAQRADHECHACRQLGRIDAKYRIEHSAALPVSVHFEPDNQQ